MSSKVFSSVLFRQGTDCSPYWKWAQFDIGASIAAACIQCWAIFLSAYTYNIVYKGTKGHASVDSL